MFLTSRDAFQAFAAGKRSIRMANFYKDQRRSLGILMDPSGNPEGDRWSFDTRRAEQARYWFKEEMRQALLALLEGPEARKAIAVLSDKVAAGEITPARAAREVLERYLGP